MFLYLKKKKITKSFRHILVELSIQHFGYNYFTLLEGFMPGHLFNYYKQIFCRCSRDACKLTFIHFLKDFNALAVSQLVLAWSLLPPKTDAKQMIKKIRMISFVNTLLFQIKEEEVNEWWVLLLSNFLPAFDVTEDKGWGACCSVYRLKKKKKILLIPKITNGYGHMKHTI